MNTAVLNEVLEHLYDSVNGYKESAKNVSDQKLKKLFEEFTAEREKLSAELAKALEDQNQEPARFGTVAGVLHRLFLDLKSLLTDNNIEAVTKEIKRGESLLMSCYQKALQEENLPPALQMILKRQLESIQDTLEKVESTAAEHESA